MTTMGKNSELFRPLDTTIKVLDGKWKISILYHLMDHKMNYGEILKSLPESTEQTLNLQLDQLTRNHIVKKETDDNYQLTYLGESLIPVIQAMNDWGEAYISTLKQNKE